MARTAGPAGPDVVFVPGLAVNRFLFVMLDPVRAERSGSGSVPYWTFFGVEPAWRGAMRYVSAMEAAGMPLGDATAARVLGHAWSRLGI